MLVNPTGLTALLPFLAKNLHFLNSTTRFAVTKIKDFDGCRMGVVTQIRRERPMCRSARLWTTLHLSLAEFLLFTLCSVQTGFRLSNAKSGKNGNSASVRAHGVRLSFA